MTVPKTPIKKIAYNCRKATLLIEKKQIHTLNQREKLELKIHLAGCSVCRIFEKQSLLINAMVKQLIHETQPTQLTDADREKIQHRINEKLNS